MITIKSTKASLEMRSHKARKKLLHPISTGLFDG